MRRPVSAQHNKTSFGEFYMTPKLQQVPKVANYRVDGSGRDSYINFNNGGCDRTDICSFKYSSKKGLSLFNSGKNYNVVPKLSKYKTDGMGRDQYIVRDCGGFYQTGSNINPYSFKTTLRSYDVKPTYYLKNDFSLLSKTHIQQPIKLKIKQEAGKQRVLSSRLSVPKRVNTKFINKLTDNSQITKRNMGF